MRDSTSPPRRPRAARLVILPALAAVAAAAPACDDWFTELEPTTVSDAAVVDLSVLTERSIRRNGRDSAVLLVRIPADARTRVVTLTTTAGSFVLTAAKSVTVRAEEDSTLSGPMLAARALLRADADTAPALAYVTAAIEGFTDTASVEFRRP